MPYHLSPIFNRILAATDQPEECGPPVITAARLAARDGASLRVIHVLESRSAENRQRVRHHETGEEIDATPTYIQSVADLLQRRCEPVWADCKAPEVRVTVGYPWEQILKWSRTDKTDLIVLGPHSERAAVRGVIRVRGRIGSTVEGVVRRERCPVMIVNRPADAETLAFSSILVCTDFSPSCESALAMAVRIARRRGGRLTVFHLLPVPPGYQQADYRRDLAEADGRLQRFCRAIPPEVPHETRIRGGVLPHTEILAAAEAADADLIILGSHTKSDGGKWYVGSVVERTGFRATHPVMVVTDADALVGWTP